MKVIYPDGVLSEEEVKELLELSIECRKRVKEQLRRMDETFEAVDFSYVQKSTGKRKEIETLEIIEYGSPDKAKAAIDLEEAETNEDSKSNKFAADLAGGQRIIRDNQTGVSYERLFGAYLSGSVNIKVIDPYIRLPYQIKNFMEFAMLVVKNKEEGQEIKLHLVTNNNEDYIANAREAFREITDTLAPLDILFSFEFDESSHDRSIELNNGWKIVLGRGLDIFQKTNGRYDIAEYYQEKRLCKACEITFVKG